MKQSYAEQYVASQEAGKSEELVTEFITWKEKGHGIIGRLIRQETIKTKEDMDPVQRYVLDTDTGIVSCLLGGATDKQLSGKLNDGDMLAITFMGKKKLSDGTRSVNIFEIERF